METEFQEVDKECTEAMNYEDYTTNDVDHGSCREVLNRALGESMRTICSSLSESSLVSPVRGLICSGLPTEKSVNCRTLPRLDTRRHGSAVSCINMDIRFTRLVCDWLTRGGPSGVHSSCAPLQLLLTPDTWEPKTLISNALAVYLSGAVLVPPPHAGATGMELSLAKPISLLLPGCSPLLVREFNEFRDDKEACWSHASEERGGGGRLDLRGNPSTVADPGLDKTLAATPESKNRIRDLASA